MFFLKFNLQMIQCNATTWICLVGDFFWGFYHGIHQYVSPPIWDHIFGTWIPGIVHMQIQDMANRPEKVG